MKSRYNIVDKIEEFRKKAPKYIRYDSPRDCRRCECDVIRIYGVVAVVNDDVRVFMVSFCKLMFMDCESMRPDYRSFYRQSKPTGKVELLD